MDQLSIALGEKIDVQLAELCNKSGLAPSERIPVVVQCEGGKAAEIAQQVVSLGGTIRHQLLMLGIVAAWLPLVSVSKLVRLDSVKMVELEQQFTAA